jgi:perosamine synthetase
MGAKRRRPEGAKQVIPVNEPALGHAELARVTEAVRAGHVSSGGPEVLEFEEHWAAYCGRRHGVAVTNGTAALELAVACLDLDPGDEIIMPTFTIISCALAATNRSAIPRLVDADSRTWCMDANLVGDAIGPRTRAVMLVHVYGHPVNIDPVLELAERHGLAVIEDAAQAHGAEYQSNRNGATAWRRCGSFGAMSCFSFYANKLVTTGEGGMLVTDDAALAQRARLLRNLAFEGDRRFRHEHLGFNFRMSNLQAALGIAQVARMDEIVAKKRTIATAYTQGLRDVAGITLPVEEPWARSVYWMYGLVVGSETGLDAEALAKRLSDLGVETRPFFLGLHEQPVFRRRGWFINEKFPVAERLARQGLYLPSGLGLRTGQIEQVIDAVRRCLT